MKTAFRIVICALALVVVQACGSKSKENAEATDATVAAELTPDEKAAAEKEEARQKRMEAQKERTRMAAEKREKAEAFYKDDVGMVVYNKSEVPPAFPGGDEAMNKYFTDNLQYPEVAKSKGLEGEVYIEFIVGSDGKIRGATVSDETDPDADQSLKDEALRVVNNMPKWAPAKQHGTPVSAKYNLPVSFKIS